MRPEDERWRRPFELVAHREARRRRLGWVPEWLDLQIGEEIMKARLADAQARIRELEGEVERLRRPHPAAVGPPLDNGEGSHQCFRPGRTGQMKCGPCAGDGWFRCRECIEFECGGEIG